jgi:molecular chaperone GrpE
MKKKQPKMEVDPSLIEEAIKCVEQPAAEEPSKQASEPTSTTEGAAGDFEAKYKETYDRLVRLTADFENFRKRTQKEKSDLVQHGNENLVREILPVIDNFERAIEHFNDSTDVGSLRTGVELILTQLKSCLEKFGVTTQPSMGEPFDPLYHEAVGHVESTDHPPNSVMLEHQKAYFLNGRLIRPAMVTVARAPDEEEVKSENVN